MSNAVITVEHLSKRYVIDHQRPNGDNGLRHAVERAVRTPLEWLRSGTERSRSGRGEFWALRDVNLEIKQGEVVGIIGRNGAGKSTLLKVLSRITEPTSGRARIQGRVASLLEVGTGFHTDLTGRENIFLNGAILGMRRAEIIRKFDEIVAFAGVESFIDTPVKRYSSGMQVRLAFAVAAHLEPEILIVDEVLAVGDAEFQRKCLSRMDEIARGHGRTILFVSHNMGAIQHLCSRCVVFDKGQVQLEDTPEAAIRQYVNGFTPSTELGSLSDRSDRSGNGRVRLTDFHIEDSLGHRMNGATSGMDVVFVFGYEVAHDCDAKKVDVGLSIASRTDQVLFVLYSSYTGVYLDPPARHGSFRCHISKLPLPPGSYVVGARVVVDHDEADWPWGGVGHFDVDNGDFYRTGSPGFTGPKLFLVDGQWTVIGDSPSDAESRTLSTWA